MKKKLLVVVVALLVVTAIVGSAFAVYAKDATPRTVALSTGDAVTLGISSTANFSLAGLNPDTDKDLSVTLTATNVAKAEAGKAGKFTVIIAAHSAAAADVSLAAAISVSAAGTYSDSTAYAADNAALTAGDIINLSKIPTTMVLTFSIEDEDFADAAEGAVDITLKWEIVDTWELDANAYYLVGTMNGWTISNDTYKFGAGNNGNQAELLGVELTAGTEFRVNKSTGNVWLSAHGESDAVKDGSIGYANGNTIINTTGTYNFYINGSGELYVSVAD